ncbi:hypothetical protein BCBD1442_29330 [Brucella ceti]|nr:hypothetical protein BCBD1442_29330 [Brucella ceti]
MAPSANIGVEEPDPLLRLEERFGEREEELRFLAAIVCFLSDRDRKTLPRLPSHFVTGTFRLSVSGRHRHAGSAR